MARHDSQPSTGESALGKWLRATVVTVERNVVKLGTAALFLATATLGLVGHTVATTPFARNMSALVVWFSVIFAVAATLVGVTIKVHDLVTTHLGDRW